MAKMWLLKGYPLLASSASLQEADLSAVKHTSGPLATHAQECQTPEMTDKIRENQGWHWVISLKANLSTSIHLSIHIGLRIKPPFSTHVSREDLLPYSNDLGC